MKFIYRVKGALQYIIYGKFAKNTVYDLIRNSNNKFLITIFCPLAMILYTKWKYENEKRTI